MFAIQLISNDILPLKKSDSAEVALMLLNDFKVKHLPVVENNKILGFVSEKMLLDNLDKKTENLMQTDVQPYTIGSGRHIFEVIHQLAEHQLSTLTVVDEKYAFKGIITASDLTSYLHQNTLLQQPGSVIVLQMLPQNYSLAELSKIAESNNVKILACLISNQHPESKQIQVHLKFNSNNLKFVRQSFERFGYEIVFANHTDEDDELFNTRYNWLIKYINT